MRRGDISNRVNPAFMFNIDNLLFTNEKLGIFDTLEQAFFNLTDNKEALFFSRKIHKDFENQLSYIYYKSEYNIYLVSTEKENEELYKTVLKNKLVPHNRLMFFDDIFGIRVFVDAHRYKIHYYVDSDESNVLMLGDAGLLFSDMKKIHY